MSSGKLSEHHTSVERFLDNYLFILRKNSVPKGSIAWYRKHVEAYIKTNKSRPLCDRTGLDIDCYPNAKDRLPEPNTSLRTSLL